MAYRSCTYADIFDDIQSRPHPVGQGGRWEANTDEVSRAMVMLDASLYSFLARELRDAYGLERAKTICCQAIRSFGRFRGTAMRRRVEDLGLPLDVARLQRYWDLPSPEEAWTTSNHVLLPHFSAHDLTDCPFNDMYKLLCPEELALILCEEVHVAVAKGFNQAIDVRYPALLTRGEGKCIFRFEMTMEEAEKALRWAPNAQNEEYVAGPTDAPTSYRLLGRQLALLYHFMTDETSRNLGRERTEDLLRRAIGKWGAWRGQQMREVHQEKGLPLNVESLIRYYDDPAAGDAWVARNVRLTANEYTVEITQSAVHQAFDQVGTGRLAAIFYEQALPAQARAYNSKITVTIPQLLERGDPVSQYHYVLTE